MNSREQTISVLLKDLGVTPGLSGYQHLRYAIGITMDDMSLVHNVTTRLYPMIAEHFNTTASRTERCIRHAVETAWNRGNLTTQGKIFGYTVDYDRGKPTNTEFIATVADHLLLTGAQ